MILITLETLTEKLLKSCETAEPVTAESCSQLSYNRVVVEVTVTIPRDLIPGTGLDFLMAFVSFALAPRARISKTSTNVGNRFGFFPIA